MSGSTTKGRDSSESHAAYDSGAASPTPGLSVPTDEELGADALKKLDQYPPMNIVRYIALAPTLLDPIMEYYTRIMELDLDPKLREIVICRVGAKARAEYELFQHTAVARANNISEEELAAVLDDAPVTTLSADANLLCAAADELETTARLTDETTLALQARWEPRVIVEWLLVMSSYSLISRFLNAARVPKEARSPVAGHKDALHK